MSSRRYSSRRRGRYANRTRACAGTRSIATILIRLDLLRRRVLAQLDHVRHAARRKPPPSWCAGIRLAGIFVPRRSISSTASHLRRWLARSGSTHPPETEVCKFRLLQQDSPNGRHAVIAPACRFYANSARTHGAVARLYRTSESRALSRPCHLCIISRLKFNRSQGEKP